MKFGMREFCLVTGLKCSPYPPEAVGSKVVNDGYPFVEKVREWVKKERKKEEENNL